MRMERVGRVREVADYLGIPLDLIELDKTFTEKVIRPFLEGYLAGVTPNPCVVCNEVIKFEHLVRAAIARGSDFIATGHYARVFQDGEQSQLLRGLDQGKEQSYFLHRLTREQLSRTVLPLGHFRKDEVRLLAEGRGLPVPPGSESQEICFIPDNDYRSFLQAELGMADARKGDILNKEGEKVGEHAGAYRFTIGQRHGLGIASPRPYYVMEIRAEENRIIVGRKEDLYSRRVEAGDAYWISGEPPDETESLLAQVRYRHKAAPGRLQVLPEGKLIFEFSDPQWAITPGQAVVIYQGDQVLGGGWISGKMNVEH
jgi:tRNA-specific 2-thiouridylase